MTRLRGLAAGLLAICAGGAPVAASDRWETTFHNLTDDTSSTPNVLRHAQPQVGHDLEGNPDEDWAMIRVKNGHSYEARVSSDTVYFDPACGSPECPRFDRVSAGGVVMTAGVVSSDDVGGFDFGPGLGLVSSGLTVRWVSSSDGKEFLRVRGDAAGAMPAGLNYTLEFYDTTYFVPRWNNTATQQTVFIIQNTTNAAVNATILFFIGNGTQIYSQGFTAIPINGVVTFSTASVTTLANQAGSARIVHNGGYGALAGKAVALEPATGFTFDTAMEPLPR